MEKASLPLPEVALIAGTRGILGAGLRLLLAERLMKDQRKAAGWVLFLAGAVTTVPLMMDVLSCRR